MDFKNDAEAYRYRETGWEKVGWERIEKGDILRFKAFGLSYTHNIWVADGPSSEEGGSWKVSATKYIP